MEIQRFQRTSPNYINSQQILNYGELSKIINTPQSKKEIDLHICALNFEYIFDSLSRNFSLHRGKIYLFSIISSLNWKTQL